MEFSNRSEIFTHPEVELRMKNVGNEWHYPYLKKSTSLDILEVYANNTAMSWRAINSEEFEEYCHTQDLEDVNNHLVTRIIFIEDLFLPPQVHDKVDPSELDPNMTADKTALLMHRHLGVPMLFFRDQAPVISHLTIGNATFTRRRKDGNKEITFLDGYYQYCSDYAYDKPTHVWYSHSTEPKKRPCNYIINHCSPIAKRLIFDCSVGPDALLLARPFVIDGFLFNDIIMQINRLLIDPRAQLLQIERITFTDARQMENKAKNITILHDVARGFHILNDTIGAIRETLEYLVESQKVYTSLVAPGDMIHDPDRETARESLILIKSKANSINRELLSLQARAALKIDLEYSLENQQDSRTNLKIAKLTTNIAAASQQDSSSMITMAAVTMFFLPGTFVSAVFSMIFFSTNSSNDGSQPGNLVVSPQWWLFPLVTIPLTIIVFLVWKVWRQRRNVVDEKELQDTIFGTDNAEDQSKKVKEEITECPPPQRRTLLDTLHNRFHKPFHLSGKRL